MSRYFGIAMMAASLGFAAGAAKADEQVSESRNVEARIVKVSQGGVINLTVKQGPTAALTLYGEKRDLAKVTVTQRGDSLQIDTESWNWNFGGRKDRELRAELTLPKLNEFASRGVGNTTLQGFSGDEVKLSLDGAGSLTVNSKYRKVVARLGGVGSMTLNDVASDKLDLNLRGAGHIAVNGQSKLLNAELGGVGSLDAENLRADTVTLDMSGMGGATVFARNTANLSLSGLGSATVYGKPASRTATARGLGSVNWD